MKMMNSSLPPLPSHIFNFGDNDCRMPIMDVPPILDSKLNDHTVSLWSLPRLFNDEEMRCASFGVHYFQHIVDPQPGYQSTSSGNVARTEQPHRQIEKNTILTHNTGKLNGRKRPLEAKQQESSAPAAEEKTAHSEWEKKNERRRALFSVQQPHPRSGKCLVDLHKSKATMNRSQKIGDRITALQKLVSPYGKTDTASVLQEASLYIRLLQEQVQNQFQMLSSSYSSSIRPLQQQEKGKRQTDLRSRGFCLVPVSSIEEVIKGTKVDDHSIHHYDH